MASALKAVYQAPTEAAAAAALDAFEAGPRGRRIRASCAAGVRVGPRGSVLRLLGAVPPGDYTTNVIESLNSTVRRAVRTRGHFPNDRAATKLIYLALAASSASGADRRPTGTRFAGSSPVVLGDRFQLEAS